MTTVVIRDLLKFATMPRQTQIILVIFAALKIRRLMEKKSQFTTCRATPIIQRSGICMKLKTQLVQAGIEFLPSFLTPIILVLVHTACADRIMAVVAMIMQ